MWRKINRNFIGILLQVFYETLALCNLRVNAATFLSFRSIGTERKSFIQGGSGTVYRDLFRFWDGYFLSPMHYKRARQIFPENLFRQSRYIHARGLIRLVGIVQLQDLSTWPCLLCARVIHFFLLGSTSRRVVDRTILDSPIFYERRTVIRTDDYVCSFIHHLVIW